IGTVDVADTSKEELSEMMVGRKVNLQVEKADRETGEVIFRTNKLCVKNKATGKLVVNNVSLDVRAGEIVCVAGIDGNGQSELVYALTGLITPDSGTIELLGKDITHQSIRERNTGGIGHIPEDRHK
ncbi:MAG: ATP-binding cassette domain-containing protein, partial [Hydrogenoanaerobacterium sp.]